MQDMATPNTFISETGEVIILHVEELDDYTKSHLNMCSDYCQRIRTKYGTSDLKELLKAGINRREIQHYVDALHDLLNEGYDE